ncbi:MAG: 50S ribosomal protein L13 [Candidatus Undinarchaeales archaeon]|jgi:large subunit ribosomal protein L13|nr:50S ribosomal protein L13 [Candidatus Undinarchaeales archaeon]
MKIIDATDLKVGRLASYTAKEALKGETIRIVNADKAVVTGTKSNILERYKFKRTVGSRYQGPFYPKRADRILKRAIRGMLPYKKQRGRDALDRVRAYLGVPEELAKQKAVSVEIAHIGEIENRLYMTLNDLSQELGSKIMEESKAVKSTPKAESKPEKKEKEPEKKEEKPKEEKKEEKSESKEEPKPKEEKKE